MFEQILSQCSVNTINTSYYFVTCYSTMNMRYLHIIIAAAFLSSFQSCKKTETPNFHFEYFGYESGSYVIYDVVEITHDKQVEQHDTLHYQLKTKWGEEFIDNEGRSGKEYLRFTRTNDSEPWVLTDKWHGIIDGIRAELVEENQRLIKLVFSPTLYKEWDLNAYNVNGEASSYYRNIHQDTTINGVLIDSVLTVEYDEGYSSKIDSVNSYEMYAKGIGLIYKHYINNHFQFLVNGQVDPEVNIGRELYFSYKSSGKE